MALSPGTRLGPYDIVGSLGAGGMGEVYRATDANLKRAVAIKVLPAALSMDPDRLARFQREAELLAALNHPNIAHVYGLERVDGTAALVMELVEGDTLADRIARGPIPIEEALPIAKQIAEALEAAHEQGIIHRDLKPANIKVRDDGTVKVLDFGLAKLNDPIVSNVQNPPNVLSLSPTITSPALMTGVGVLLGTAAYMSPEQAKGRPADKRSDIWAFGCVLYEMLSGKRPFAGDDVSDTLAAVLRADPDWTLLPASTPHSVRALLRRCLEKDRKRRLHDIGDASIFVEDLTPAPPGPAKGSSGRRREHVAWAIAALFVAASIGLVIPYFRTAQEAAWPTRFVVSPPRDATVAISSTQLVAVVSPDGRQVVFVASSSTGGNQIWVRSLDTLDAQPVPGTIGASLPFWSPDSRSIGFFAGSKLRTVTLPNGPVQSIADAVAGRGGSWNRDGIILFSPGSGGLFRISATGGQPVPLTTGGAPGTVHRYPSWLPDGRRFVYVVYPSNEIWLGSLDGQPPIRLLSADSQAQYVAPGYLLFAKQGTLFAQPFDQRRAATTGDAVPVVEQIASDVNLYAPFSASDNGTIVYRAGASTQTTQLSWFDRTGKLLGPIGQPGAYRNPLLSPDGRRLAVEITDQAHSQDIWILELARGVLSRFTFDPHNDIYLVWSPDGNQLAFGSDRDGGLFGIYEKQSSGAAGEQLLLKSSSEDSTPYSWSPDGRFILHRAIVNGYFNTGILPLTGERKSRLFQQSNFTQASSQVSPDGRWIAYISNESGRYEIYVQTFPMPGGKWQISRDGGINPKWSASGRELFYYSADGELMAVPIAGSAALQVGTVTPLFKARMLGGSTTAVGFRAQYDVTADGKRFLLNVPMEDALPPSINVILNWRAGLRK